MSPTTSDPRLRRFARYAWGLLAFNIGVILWGAFVRATGSGAGCGEHWPTCNGEVVPRAESLETLIELTHRATSGLALIGTLVLLVWAFRAAPRGHRVRRGAVLSMLFMVGEALVGAVIVLFGLTADNASMARAAVMAVHLCNTFLLLAAFVLTAAWASGLPAPSPRRPRWLEVGVALVALAMMILGASGGITALGDTLFPAESLAEGLAQDFSPTAHILLRLRLFHPLIAMATAGLAILLAGLAAAARPTPLVRRLAVGLVVLLCVQICAGFLNVALLAPVWMQLVHLLLADAIWCTFVLMAAAALARPSEVAELGLSGLFSAPAPRRAHR